MKTLGKDIQDEERRRRFLEDNAHGVEKKSYMKPYTPEELQGHKENLANVLVEINELENELQTVKDIYKEKLKPLKEACQKLVQNIKAKAELVTEDCFRFTDDEERTTAFYNSEGDCIEERPATADELQPNLIKMGLMAAQ